MDCKSDQQPQERRSVPAQTRELRLRLRRATPPGRKAAMWVHY
jgi:hypothetical protein